MSMKKQMKEKFEARINPTNFSQGKTAASYLMKFVRGVTFEELEEDQQQKVRDLIEWLQDLKE